MTKRLCVIGGDAAGMSAASQVRRSSKETEVVVFEMGSDVSYAACGIPYFIAGLVPGIDDLVARSASAFREQGIDLRLRSEVKAIDASSRRLEVWDHESSSSYEEPFDYLMIGTGARALMPPGFELAYPAHNLNDARQLDELIQSNRPKRVVVAGGGYIGLEMAEAFRIRGLETHMVEMQDHVMATLDTEMAVHVEDALEKAGVELHLGAGISQVLSEGGRVTGVVAGEREIPCDLVVAGLGSRPRSEIASEAGIEIGESGAIAVDHAQQTSVDGVYAAGDCAEVFHLVRQRWVNIHLGTIANKAGRVAGLNIAGGRARLPGVVGTAMSRICETEVARTGLSEREASTDGRDYVSAAVTTSTRAHYYPGAGEMHLKMLADPDTKEILGTQIVGLEGAAKRIDVIATAITAGMTVSQVVDLDLSYAPPFSSVWDPVQVVARRLSSVMDSSSE
ncbi:MAG: flavoprotein oxidoreductase [Acidobacteria bacterium]|nr:MAG: flavoprotein oxidoreductase [Acidobacteriota bacterium]